MIQKSWGVEYTDEFEAWWDGLTAYEQGGLLTAVALLEKDGPALGFPHSSRIVGARHRHMRELRAQYRGRPYRILYAFDPRRMAILLIGGSKAGQDRWYERYIPIADRLYDEHLETLKREGLIDG